ncbi:hypothetical protein [Halorubrum salsamenti]|uniref:hypothetical protein n=1 Tax=Halorubrum salsamenti TaxID=2583990 RepID=UPI0011A75517|nr:hypothetical protein [Halorubrum salsamenti]
MSNEPMTGTDPYGHPVVDRLRTEQSSVVVGAAVVAAVSVLGQTGLTIAGNLPFDPMSGLSLLDGLFSIITPLSLFAAAGAIAFTVNNSLVKVGLLFTAAFVILGSISPAAGLPAVLGVIIGGTVSLFGAVQREVTAGSHRQVPLVGSAILGITVSLGGTVGVAPGGAQAVGVGATLVAIALLGLEMPVDRPSVSVGLIAAVGVLSVGTWAPFVTGATLLVGFSITNIPVLVVAVAVLGGVTALTSAVRNRVPLPVAGCVLCLFSGIPTTPASAAALVIGLTSIMCREALAHQRGEFA